MTKIKIRDIALPDAISAVKRVGSQEIPVKYSREYSKFIKVQDDENKALVLAHSQLNDKLKAANPECKEEAEKEFQDYLDKEIDVELLPHDILSQISTIAPMDLFLIQKLIASTPQKGV